VRRDVDRLLRGIEPPGAADAEERARRVVRGAFAERPTRAPRRRTRPAAVAVAAALLVVAAATAVAPARDAVGDWVRNLVHRDAGAPHARPALHALPAPGRLLVISRRGAWVVPQRGARRLLGPYAGATWSPHGLFVAAWRGRELTAVEPTGRVHWSLAAQRPVTDAWWSPDGYRIVYRTGPALRVVAGDGTGARALAPAAARAGAWRPGPGYVFAFVDARGVVQARRLEPGRVLWRHRPPTPPFLVQWSADGRRVVLVGRRRIQVLDARGRALREIALASGTRLHAAALAPTGLRLAVVARGADGRTDVSVVDLGSSRPLRRSVFSAAGRLDRVAWSPDGRWLLVTWPRADQWLFVRARRVHRLVAVSGIASQFDPAHRRAARTVAPAGWCCAR
jgi:hypothetical protein